MEDEPFEVDEKGGTFLTSVKGSKNDKSLKHSCSTFICDQQKAMVLFGHPQEGVKKFTHQQSLSALRKEPKLLNLKKPPIYLPELRERKDVWMGKTSGEILAERKPKIVKSK